MRRKGKKEKEITEGDEEGRGEKKMAKGEEKQKEIVRNENGRRRRQ